jgi:hypothetical protein
MTFDGQISISIELRTAPRLAAHRAITFDQKAASCVPAMEFSA